MGTGWEDAAVAPAVHPEHVSHNTLVKLTWFFVSFPLCMTLRIKTEASVIRRCVMSLSMLVLIQVISLLLFLVWLHK